MHFLKTKASPGLHGVSAKYFKIYNKVVSPVLAKLFNKCLQEENFFDTLKQSKIIPVPKINSPTPLTDFRPAVLNWGCEKGLLGVRTFFQTVV